MKKLIFAFAVLALAIAPVVAVAQNENAKDARERRMEQIEQREAAAVERAERRCEIVQARLETFIDKADVRKEARGTRYEKIKDRLTTVAEGMVRAGLSDDELRDYLREYQSLVVEYEAAVLEYETSLSELQPLACTSPEAFTQQLTDIRDNKKAVIDTQAGIRAYVKDTVVPYLGEVKDQLETPGETINDSEEQ